MSIISQLGKSILIGSGAIGTCLRRQFGSTGQVEALNLIHPDAVRALHQAYRDAGSQILIANTFAANCIIMEDELAEQCDAINRTGVELAREVAQRDCAVWASMGPLSLNLRHADYEFEQLQDIYTKQCRVLKEADAIVLETCTDIRETKAAVEAINSIKMPFILQIGNVGTGPEHAEKIEQFIEIAISGGAIAIGTNCRNPSELLDVAGYLASRTKLPITAAPNAGQPAIERGLITYNFSPDDFLATAQKLLSLGVSVIGGCCGTTPEHIKKISKLAGQPVRTRKTIEAKPKILPAEETLQHPTENKIRRLMTNNSFVISVEIRADRKQTLEEIITGVSKIASAGADMFDVPDNPGATISRDAMVTASTLQKRLGLPSICHMTVTQSNLLRLHSSLIGCWDSGLQGVLAITGDSPAIGELAHSAKRVSDLRSSVELLRLIQEMKKGKTIHDQHIADAPDLCAGCAVGGSTPAQIEWLKKKVDAGAEYVFSQPIFTIEDFERLRDAVAPLKIRLLPGIMPLTSRKSAEVLSKGQIPGIKVPPAMVAAFDQVTDRESQRRLGIDKAIELAKAIAETSQGLYIIMPFGKTCYTETAQIISSVRTT